MLDPFFCAQRYENSHSNFTNLYMWRKPYHIHWAVEDGVLYLINEWAGKVQMLQPFGPKERMQGAIARVIAWFQQQGAPLFFVGLERSFTEELDAFPDADFDVQADRDNFDYVYLAENLIHLTGRKYHSKKNHLNSFHKAYPQAEYLPITRDIIPQCREELNRWYRMRSAELPDDPFIGYELAAIHEVFDHFGDFKLQGGAVRIDDSIVAFTFGEQTNEDTAVIHVEKADPDVRGAYPAINQGFVAHAWSDMTYINREEDMGLEGLRKAKESYKPVKMIEKFNAKLR